MSDLQQYPVKFKYELDTQVYNCIKYKLSELNTINLENDVVLHIID